MGMYKNPLIEDRIRLSLVTFDKYGLSGRVITFNLILLFLLFFLLSLGLITCTLS